jgi:hypothetical protein
MNFAAAQVNYEDKSYNQIPNPTNTNNLKEDINYLEYTSKTNLSYQLFELKQPQQMYKCIYFAKCLV